MVFGLGKKEQAAPEEKPMRVDREMTQSLGMEISSELFRLKLLPKETVLEIENNLRGIEWDDQQQTWVQYREPLMNEEGINTVMTQCIKPVVNKEIFQSNLDEGYIDRCAIQFEDNLADTLFANFNTFELRSKQNMNNMVEWIGNMVYCSLRRAMNGGERRGLIGNEVKESITQTPMGSNRPSLLGGMFKR